jgi:hypothetical protein
MSATIMETPNIWEQYLDEFDYFSHANIRPGCHPRILEHEAGSPKAVLLVHGLSDSPYFVSVIRLKH